MKSRAQTLWQSTSAVLLCVIAIALILQGCGIKAALRKIDARMAEAIHSMDKAIATLNQESADWQTVIADLEQDITAEMQSTISAEVQNLTRNAVLTAGGEVRCNAEFMRIKLRRELIDIRNSLAQSLNNQLINLGISGYQFDILQQEAPEPFICDIVPSAVDMSLDPVRRQKLDIYGFDLRSMPIYVTYRSYGVFQAKPSVGYREYVTEMRVRAERAPANVAVIESARLKDDIKMGSFNLTQPWKVFHPGITSSLTVLSDFHAVLDLTEAGANLPPNADVIVLSWNNELQAEIPILTHLKTLECTTTAKPLTVNLVSSFIPPAVGSGDNEFKDHGPCMSIYLYLTLDAERRNLYATYTVDAFECNDDFGSPKHDHTRAYGTKTVTLYTAAEDETIISYNSAVSLYDTHIDFNHDPFVKYYGGTSPVEKIEWMGDTKGDEAGTRTGVTVTFRQFDVNVQKCVYK